MTNKTKTFFSSLRKMFFAVKIVVGDVKNKYTSTLNNVLNIALKHNPNSKELAMFLTVLIWLSGLAIMLYFYTLINTAISCFVCNKNYCQFNKTFINKRTIVDGESKSFDYWSSTLYSLIKSNQFNVFLK